MRKIVAISFLLLHLYNVIGYKAIFAVLEKRAEDRMLVQIDNNQYNDQQLVEMKLFYPRLYYSISTNYERFDGKIEISGKNYNYVKRRFANDTLYLLCLPNETQNRITAAKKLHIVNETQGSDQKQNNRQAKYFSADLHYLSHQTWIVASPEVILTHHAAHCANLTRCHPTIVSPPPELA